MVDVREGCVIGSDFVVGRLLGRGGMGAVYAAHQLSTGRARAIKVLHPDLARDERSRARFVEEARVPGRVASPHLCETITAGVDPQTGVLFLVMELLEGETLGARLKRGPLPPAEALRFLGQIASALGAAHRARLVHRDLKPENVFIARHAGGETIKILDFGVAKTLRPDGSSSTTTSVGSPAWMAPEQAAAGHVGPWTDVWAFALVAFEALTGVVYWLAPRTTGGTVTSLLKEILSRDVVPASSRSPRPLPAGFDAWFARAMAREPTARFPDLDAAWSALEPILVSNKATEMSSLFAGAQAVTNSLYFGPTAVQPVRAPPPRGRAALVAAAIAGVFVLAGLAASLLLYRRQDAKPAARREADEEQPAASSREGKVKVGRPGATGAAERVEKEELSTCKRSELDTDCACRGSCVWACPEGACEARAETGSSLNADCKGGNCEFFCASGSTCNVSCSGGLCAFRCAAGADCTFACGGGLCTVACNPKAKRCLRSCSGGMCEEE